MLGTFETLVCLLRICDIKAKRDKPSKDVFRVELWDDGRRNPVERTVLRTVAYFAAPNVS